MKITEIEIAEWEDSEIGIILSESDSWILIKSVPVDYCIDGYKLINRKYIQGQSEPENVELLQRVFALKNISEALPENFEFSDTPGLLQWVEKQYGLFEFQDETEDEAFYGKINSIEGNELTIDMILVDGSLEEQYDYPFHLNSIRVISFDSDYHQSMKLLFESTK